MYSGVSDLRIAGSGIPGTGGPGISIPGTSVSREHVEYLHHVRRRRLLITASQLILLFCFIGMWEFAAAVKLIDPYIFSQPSSILSEIIKTSRDGTLLKHIGVTLGEVTLGFLLSTALGTAIAILLWWNQFFRKVLNPYLVVFNSLPKTALAPIIIAWIGYNVRAIIVTAVLTSVVVTILTVLAGLSEVSQEKIKLVETFGGTKAQVFSKVVLPASVPTIINALEINIGLSFVGVIVGEMLVAQSGLGFLNDYSRQILKMDWAMMSVIILAVLAMLMYQAVVALEKKFIRR